MLTALRRRIATDDGDDAGFSLAELLVAMTLAVAVGSLVVTWLVRATDTNTVTTDSSLANADARNVLQSWAKYLQLGASPTLQGSGSGRITALSATSITFNANLRNVQTCAAAGSCSALTTTPVTLSLSGGQLLEKVGSGTTTVDVGSGVTAGACLFTAYATGTTLGCSGLTQAQLDSVTSTRLAFTVTPGSGHGRAFTTTAAFTTYSNTTGGATNVPLS